MVAQRPFEAWCVAGWSSVSAHPAILDKGAITLKDIREAEQRAGQGEKLAGALGRKYSKSSDQQALAKHLPFEGDILTFSPSYARFLKVLDRLVSEARGRGQGFSHFRAGSNDFALKSDGMTQKSIHIDQTPPVPFRPSAASRSGFPSIPSPPPPPSRNRLAPHVELTACNVLFLGLKRLHVREAGTHSKGGGRLKHLQAPTGSSPWESMAGGLGQSLPLPPAVEIRSADRKRRHSACCPA